MPGNPTVKSGMYYASIFLKMTFYINHTLFFYTYMSISSGFWFFFYKKLHAFLILFL